MKVFVILFILVRTLLGNGEKLDRTYFPPSVSKYADDSRGVTEFPYELLKDSNANDPSRFSETNIPEFPEISKIQSVSKSNHMFRPEPFAMSELSSEKLYIPKDSSKKEIIDFLVPINSEKQTTYIDNNYQTLEPSSPYQNNEPNSYNVHSTDSFYGDHQSSHAKDLPAQRKLLIEKSTNSSTIPSSTISTNSTSKTSNDIKRPVMDTNFLVTPNEISKNMLLMQPQVESVKRDLILKYKNVLTPDSFAYSADTSNGLHVEQNGTSSNGVKVEGSYSYTGDDGKIYNVTYSADENGFRPLGDHLPTSPPIPEAILKVIKQAIRDKEAGIFDDGSYDENKYGYKKYQSEKIKQTKSERHEARSKNGLVMNNNIGQPGPQKILKSYLGKILSTPTTIKELANAYKPNVEFSQSNKTNSGRNRQDTTRFKNYLNGSATMPLNTSAIFKSSYFYMRPNKILDLPNMEKMYSTTEESLQTSILEEATLEPYMIPNFKFTGESNKITSENKIFNDLSDKNDIVDAEKISTSTSNMNELISQSNFNIPGEIYLTSTRYTTLEPFELLETTLSSTEIFRDDERMATTLTPKYYTNSWKEDLDGLMDDKNAGDFNKFHRYMDYPQFDNMHLEDASDASTNLPSILNTSVIESEFHDSITQRIYPLYTNAQPTTEKLNRENISGPNQTQ